MFYLIYKITNILNGYIYIGQHTTDIINDGYMGSGIRLINAYRKHGINSFRKEILHVFSTFEEMNNKEIELVNADFIRRKDTYNIIMGGVGWNTKGTVCVECINQPGIFIRIPKEFYDPNVYKYITLGSLQVYLKSNGEKIRISVEEYQQNKHLYNTLSTGKISVFNKKTQKTSSIKIEDFNPTIHTKVLGGIVVNNNGINQYVSKEDFSNNKMKGIHQNKVTVLDKETNIRKHITRDEFISNKQRYIANGTGLVNVKDRITNETFQLDKNIAMKNKSQYIIGTEGWKTVFDIKLNKFINIKKENFDKKQHKLASDKKIVCYNNDNSIKFEFWGAKIDFLKTYKCPSSVWNVAIKQTVFQSKHKASKEFNGCSFTLIKWKP